MGRGRSAGSVSNVHGLFCSRFVLGGSGRELAGTTHERIAFNRPHEGNVRNHPYVGKVPKHPHSGNVRLTSERESP